jgi:hypothetical protein
VIAKSFHLHVNHVTYFPQLRLKVLFIVKEYGLVIFLLSDQGNVEYSTGNVDRLFDYVFIHKGVIVIAKAQSFINSLLNCHVAFLNVHIEFFVGLSSDDTDQKLAHG